MYRKVSGSRYFFVPYKVSQGQQVMVPYRVSESQQVKLWGQHVKNSRSRHKVDQGQHFKIHDRLETESWASVFSTCKSNLI